MAGDKYEQCERLLHCIMSVNQVYAVKMTTSECVIQATLLHKHIAI